MIQKARPWLVDFHAAATLDGFLVLWVLPLDCFWCFLRLEIFVFLLGLLQVFRNFSVRVWGVSSVIGLGSLVSALFFLVLPTPPLSAGPGVVLFVCLFAFFFFRPADPPTQYWAMVRVIGPLN